MNKKKKNLFFKVLFLLFLVYIALIIAYQSGYYETKVKKEATLTKEAMEKFEEDVKNGEVIDIKNYLKKDNTNYSNNITKIGNKLSEGVSELLSGGVANAFKVLKNLFW